MKPQWTIVLAVLFLTGCPDSKNPLSDPTTSKPDERLFGVWQQRWDGKGNVTYYHIGTIGKGLPRGIMRVVTIPHSENGQVDSPGDILVFPTTIQGKTYLNWGLADKEQMKLLEKRGWKADVVTGYALFKYQVEGDKLSIWPMDGYEKRRAVETGKVKGEIKEDEKGDITVVFTDTTENVARLVVEAGDSLFGKKPVIQLERVANRPGDTAPQSTHSEQQREGSPVAAPPLRPLGSGLKVDQKDIIWDQGKPVGIWGIDGHTIAPAELQPLRKGKSIIWDRPKPAGNGDETKSRQ